MEELQVLEKHNVGTRLYRKWLADELFADELRFRIESAKRTGELIIARYTPMAAAKLVALTESDKAETVRKACIDIMSGGLVKKRTTQMKEAGGGEEACELAPGLAGKLLEVLAEHTEQRSAGA